MRYCREDGDVGDVFEPGSPGAIQAQRERRMQKEWNLDVPQQQRNTFYGFHQPLQEDDR